MAHLLLIDGDADLLASFEVALRVAGHAVRMATSGLQGLDILRSESVDLVLSDLHLSDISGFDVVRYVRDHCPAVPVVVITEPADPDRAVTAMRLGATDCVEKPLFERDLLRTVSEALSGVHDDYAPTHPTETRVRPQTAAGRWACLISSIVTAPADPRTVTAWSRLALVPPNTLRNWCALAGISPRRSLVFGRLLRAVILRQHGHQKPENLLDVVDRRTLAGLLELAGLNPRDDFPTDIDGFVTRQALVRAPEALLEIRRVLTTHNIELRRNCCTPSEEPRSGDNGLGISKAKHRHE